MKGMVPLDPQSEVSQPRFAVVYVPKRNRKRFAAKCVTVMDTQAEAMQAANPDEKMFAAIVVGPSKSSEGQYIYYLAQWLS